MNSSFVIAAPCTALCYRFVGNHEDAADLAQEAFLRAYRALRTFKGDSAVGTWLHRIAVNVSLNAVAGRARRSRDERRTRGTGAVRTRMR